MRNESLCIAVLETKMTPGTERVAPESLDFGFKGVINFSQTSTEERTTFPEVIHSRSSLTQYLLGSTFREASANN